MLFSNKSMSQARTDVNPVILLVGGEQRCKALYARAEVISQISWPQSIWGNSVLPGQSFRPIASCAAAVCGWQPCPKQFLSLLRLRAFQAFSKSQCSRAGNWCRVLNICIFTHTYATLTEACSACKLSRNIALVTHWYSFQVGPLLGHWCRLTCWLCRGK